MAPRWAPLYSSDFLRDRVSFESEVDKRSESFAGMLRMLPILPAIAQRVGPASMNDANARDWNPLREESSWATEEDVHWLSKNRSLAIEEWKLLLSSLWLSQNGSLWL